MVCLLSGENFDDTITRFDIINERDRRTDTETDTA